MLNRFIIIFGNNGRDPFPPTNIPTFLLPNTSMSRI